MKKLILSLLVGLNCGTYALCAQTSKTSPVSFSGCWDSDWSDCNSNGKIIGGAKLSFKQAPHNKSCWYGAWGGETDSQGGQHSGFVFGTLKGNVLTGAWYEVIYKNTTSCPNLTYSGTFQFTVTSVNAFKGTYTDINGPCKNSKFRMSWNGKR